MSKRSPGFDTLAIHAGAKPDPTTGARTTPIYQTASYVFDDVDHAAALFGLQAFGNIYTRLTNPTTAVLEERVAALEGGTAAVATASGHAAQLLVFHNLLRTGDNFVAANKLYGGSINQFGNAFKSFGWEVRWGDVDDVSSFEKQIDDKTRAIFIESLANPGGIVVDIAAIAEIAHKHGLPLIVDNTMASPYLIRPIEHGADIVVHSLTKFIGGHGNSMGGILVDGGTFDWSKSGNYPMLSEPRPEYAGAELHKTFGNIAFAIAARTLGLRDFGPAISPFNSFQILAGIETLPLRMQRHCDNALKVAQWLEKHEKVSWVRYAGLPTDKYHALQQKYSPKGGGAVFTFGLKGGYEAGKTFANSLELFSLLANIGDTRSLVIHPASTTHRQLTDEQKVAAGAGPEVVRLSIGIEDADDIIADLEQALAKDRLMSLLLPINTESEPELGAPAEGRIISGDPQFRTWNAEETSDGLYAGIWESTEGKWHVAYDEWELFQLISGVSVVTEEGKEPVTLRAGDSFIIRPGFKGTWEVIETTRKTYVIKL